jgi:predicted anti-sigma-YlaC factor YlaD
MDCQHCQEALSEYMEGTLGACRSERIRGHLAGCPSCRQEYTELIQIRSLLSGLPAPQVRPGFWPRAYRAVQWQVTLPVSANRSHRIVQQRSGSYRLASLAALCSSLTATAIATFVLLLMLARSAHHLNNEYLYIPFENALNTHSGHKHVANRSDKTPCAAANLRSAISVDSLVAIHAGHGVMLPLSDAGRLRYLASESTKADLEQDGILDIR